jgi:glutamyl-tRNA synthetase
MKTVRTRFAPSPTGLLHVGGIRTALFAWLLARQNNGQFILRLEDTDQKREVDGADQHIIDCLKALGLDYDEGPDIGGEYGPYRQSERLDIYKKWANKLIDSGRAYADPRTPEEVQSFREAAQAAKKPFRYRNNPPENPPAWDGTQPLRFKSDPEYKAHWEGGPVIDAVMGELSIKPESTDDFVIMKTDGFPTYNFAHIVDDAEMKVTHVIRGQEFLSSMPGYLDLYDALKIKRPVFAHMPHILSEQGNKKLSKRDGAKDLLDYIREGYPPEALVNFIATMGWNDGTEQEIFSMAELIEKFSLDRVQKSGARFDEKRLLWTSGAHIRGMQLDALYENVAGFWPEEAKEYSDDHKKSILALTQERLKHYSELPELTRFFFTDLPINPELISTNKKLKKLSSDELVSLLTSALGSLVESDFTAVDLQSRLNTLLETTGAKPAILFSLIRIATTQAPASPSLAESMEIIGKEKTLARINTQLQNL